MMKSLLPGVVLLFLIAGCARNENAGAKKPGKVPVLTFESVIGARARLVWCRQLDDRGDDPFAQGTNFVLMGIDTRDGRGEREILSERDNYHRPLLSADGRRVIFSRWDEQTSYVVGFDGAGLRRIGEGVAADVWRDPSNGVEWVYALCVRQEKAKHTFAEVRRFGLDDTGRVEKVWNATEVSPDSFQVSSDGRFACGQFPWPYCGISTPADGSWRRVGRGCWPSLAPDDSLRMWIFDGSHRVLTMYDRDRKETGSFRVDRAPGMDGAEAFHPMWSNHSRLFVMTGPYEMGERRNKIRAGGSGVEVYVGRLDDRMSAVETWLQVTSDKYGDFYPDLWVDTRSPTQALPRVGSAAVTPRPPTGVKGRAVVRAKLVELTETPDPSKIEPYRRALVAHVYEVEEVLEGNVRGKKVSVAGWGIRDGKILPCDRKTGDRFQLVIEPMEGHPELRSERCIENSMDVDFDLYLEMSVSSLP